MDYTEKIAGYIERDEIKEMIAWAKLQPPLDQVEILTIFKNRLKEGIFGPPTEEGLEQIAGLEQKIDKFQESILDAKMVRLQLDFAKRDMDIILKRMLARPGAHQYIIDCIVNNAPNAEEMKALAKNAIRYEKEQGIYNADNWRGLNLG